MTFGERDSEMASISVPIFRKKKSNSWSINYCWAYF